MDGGSTLQIVILKRTYSQVSNRRPPAYKFLENFPPMTFLFHSSSLSNLGKCSSQGIFKSRQGQKKEHAKLRRLRSNVGYVGAWVM